MRLWKSCALHRHRTRIVETASNIRKRALRISERSARISGEVARMGVSRRCISGGDLLMRGRRRRMQRKQPRMCVGDVRLFAAGFGLLGKSRRLCAKRLWIRGTGLGFF